MHSYILPARQSDFRCPDCGASWSQGWNRTAVMRSPSTEVVTTAADDGWYYCCPERRFRWVDAEEVEHAAPAGPVAP